MLPSSTCFSRPEKIPVVNLHQPARCRAPGERSKKQLHNFPTRHFYAYFFLYKAQYDFK